MPQGSTIAASLIFQDGTSEREFVALSAQASSIQDLHYEFHTSPSQYGNGMQTQTVVTGRTAKIAPLVVLAQMDWVGRQFGNLKMLVTRPPVEQPMASLCLPGAEPGTRIFLLDRTGSGTTSQYSWTRNDTTYLLSGPSGEALAQYERLQSSLPPHAILHFYFDDKFLLLMALLSLTLNRWLDGSSSPLSVAR